MGKKGKSNFYFPHKSFSTLARSLAAQYGPKDVRFQAKALDVLQRHVEDHLLDVARQLQDIMEHHNSKTLMKKHFQLYEKMRCKKINYKTTYGNNSLPTAPVSRLMKELAPEYNLRKGAVEHAKAHIQASIVRLFQMANEARLSDNRKTLQLQDMQLAIGCF